jgi:hypothetical protein
LLLVSSVEPERSDAVIDAYSPDEAAFQGALPSGDPGDHELR